MSTLELLATVVLAILAIAGVTYAAYCNDVALQEWRESQAAAGDCLTPADLIRMGIVNNDGTVSGIGAGAPYWLNKRFDSAATGRDECGGPSEQPDVQSVPVGNGSHPVNGFGSDAGACEGVTTLGRESGEAAGHD